MGGVPGLGKAPPSGKAPLPVSLSLQGPRLSPLVGGTAVSHPPYGALGAG